MSAIEQLPFAVYGTLRPGCGNDHRWLDRAEASAPKRLEGFELIGAGAGFPYAVPVRGSTSTIVVNVVTPEPEHYDDVRRSLDQLEGYPRHYDRIRVEVEYEPCWIYVPSWWPEYGSVRFRTFNDLRVIEGGDWMSEDTGWWARVQAFK